VRERVCERESERERERESKREQERARERGWGQGGVKEGVEGGDRENKLHRGSFRTHTKNVCRGILRRTRAYKSKIEKEKAFWWAYAVAHGVSVKHLLSLKKVLHLW